MIAVLLNKWPELGGFTGKTTLFGPAPNSGHFFLPQFV